MTNASPKASIAPRIGSASSSSVSRRRSALVSSLRIGEDLSRGSPLGRAASAAMPSDVAAASDTGPRQNDKM